jgi:hypothetical protein
MDIYILNTDTNYRPLIVEKEEDCDELLKFDGTSLRQTWQPIKVVYDTGDFGDLPKGDFPLLATHIPVFTSRASEALADLLDQHGELLPLKCRGAILQAYNVTTVVDILDFKRSKIKRFPSSGRIMNIERQVFYTENLPASTPIFKIPQTPLMDVFVTKQFVDQVKRLKLTGFSFEQP